MIDVGRWVVGDGQLVIENVGGGQISLQIPPGEPLVLGWQVIEEARVKMTAALLVEAGAADRVGSLKELVAALDAARVDRKT